MTKPIQFVEKGFVFLWRSIPFFLVATILLINIKLHSGPDLGNPNSVRNDVRAQLVYLKRQLHEERLAERMQQIFPEGFVFTQALYGLTWCELALAERDSDHAEALTEARYAFAQIDSDLGKSTFDRDMVPAYGMFYNGWRNYLLAKIVEASKGQNLAEVERFKADSKIVAALFQTSQSPFPDSYPDQSWPADGCVGMASLGLYNRLVSPDYDSMVRQWTQRVPTLCAPGTGLLPHKTQSESGKMAIGPQGCSGVLNLYFLPEIDPAFAVGQFERFDSLFGFARLGQATVREYPRGVSGWGDSDSGPVVLGVGFTATIVGMGAYLKFGETAQAQAISDAVESLGFSFRWRGGKRYIWGMLPVADAFIAWARMQGPDARVMALRKPNLQARGSKMEFHLISLGLVALLLVWRFRKRIFQRKSIYSTSKSTQA